MKYIIYLIFTSIILNCKTVNSQQLTIDETLTYIENIENEYQGFTNRGDKVTVNYEIDADGIFTKKTMYTIENETKTVTIIKVHVDDLSQNFEYDGNSFIDINCKNRNCLEIEEDGTIYLDKKPRKSIKNEGLHVFVKQEYNAKKITKALDYLFSLINESNFNRDIDDPFADTSNTIFNNNSSKSNEIQLTERNGTYNIQVNFGTISENFVLDSGAAEVSLSNGLLKKLIKNGKISKSDILPDGLYRIADGTIISQMRVNIPQMNVGQYTVKNVAASVGNDDSPLLLGRSFLDKFSNWSVDNQRKVLNLTE